MPKKVKVPDAGRFNLASFADILPARDPIIGEDPGSFDVFHEGLMLSLAPVTPYECVIAENLISIEWELLQRRRMREEALRQSAAVAVRTAVVRRLELAHRQELDAAWERHLAEGGSEDDWEDPVEFERHAAFQEGLELAAGAISGDAEVQAAALEEIASLGMNVVELMSEAYTADFSKSDMHDRKVQELERRRREVKRDFDSLQKQRPVEGQVIEG